MVHGKAGAPIDLVLGTRPEIVKLSPVVRACQERGVPFRILHTGQHYSPEMDSAFFADLHLPAPDLNLHVGSAPHGEQTARMLVGLEKAFTAARPRAVLVQGDTNSVLAGTLAACKLGIPVGHVEAGLRSGDRRMPEELNRTATDHLADLLFAPTPDTLANLAAEGLAGRSHETGNTIVDAVQQHRSLAASSTILDRLGLEAGGYVVMTAHRAENVDDAGRAAGLLAGARRAAEATGMPVVFPAHPRTRARIAGFGLDTGALQLVEPLGYLDFLRLLADSALALTDSGGIQEEACILGVPCVTVRDNTERPETIAVGANRLAGVDPARIEAAVREAAKSRKGWKNPFGDGKAADRILDLVDAAT